MNLASRPLNRCSRWLSTLPTALGLLSSAAFSQSPDDVHRRLAGWKAPDPVLSRPANPPAKPQTVARPDASFKPEMAHDAVALRGSRVLRTPMVKASDRAGMKPGLLPEGRELDALGTALATYQQTGGGETTAGRKALEDFVSDYGDGQYGPSVRLELADAHWRTGAWDKALEQWEKAWARASRHLPDDLEGRRLGDVALAKLLHHTALLGRKDRLRTLLQEASGRRNGGDAQAALHRAKELLWFLENRAEQNIFCGFSAANLVCVPLGQKSIFPDVHDKEEEERFIASGVSLWDIAEHSLEGGGNLRCVQKTDPTAPLAVPAVIHWKFGHFSSLTERGEDGTVRLQDAQLKFNSWVDPSVIAEAGSGYALVPGDRELPAGYREVSEAEARTVFGRHCVHGYDDEGCDCTSGCSGDPGMATYSLNLRRAYHLLNDIPLTYPTAEGGTFQFSLSYSARPPAATALTSSYGFGPLWFASFGGGFVELKGTGTANSKVEWHTGSGSYNTYNNNAGVYYGNQNELPRMSYLTAGAGGPGYRLTFSDGAVLDYTVPVNSPATRYLPGRQMDPQGNATTYGYDGQARLVSITDHWGNTSVISYTPEPGDQAMPAAFPGLIRRITDPFGRFAKFLYDAEGRLGSITDPVNITSSFTYDDNDVITVLETPYGRTLFELTSSGPERSSIIVTDPRGFKEKVVQTDDEPFRVLDAAGNPVSGDPTDYTVRDWDNNDDTGGYHGDATLLAPTSVGGTSFIPKNANLHWRNSFYWDKKAMYHGADDWNAATVYNWKANSSSYIVPALSSMKKPGQARVWFNYPFVDPNETSPDGAISGYQPSKTVTAVENETGATVWTMTQQTYNALGLPSITTDELGRRKRTIYETNAQDIKSIDVFVSGAWVPLKTFTYPNPNTLHLPSTTTDLSGLVTTFTYNAKGQVTKIQKSKGGNSEAARFTFSEIGTGIAPSWPGSAGFLRKVELVDPVNAAQWVTVSEMTYDSIGRIRTHTDAGGYVRTIDYDNLDRVTLVTHPDATTEQFAYYRLDREGMKDRGGRWTRTLHNSERQPVTEIAEDNRLTLLDWCLCGQLQKLTDPLGRETKWTWAPGGYLMEKLMPDGVTKTSYTYQPNSGRLSTMTSPNQQGSGSTAVYHYYVDGQLQKEDYADVATPDVTYIYETNNLGRLSSVTDGIGTHTFNYVPLTSGTAGAGRLQFVNGPLTNDRVENVYDWQNRINTENLIQDSATTNLRAETFNWDSLGRLKTIDNTLGSFTYGYENNLSQPASLTGPNAVFSSFTYDSSNVPEGDFRHLENISHLCGGVEQAQHAYTYDSAGRLATWGQHSIGQPSGITSYDYNLAGELTRAEERNVSTGSVVEREVWGLDMSGNWLSRSLSGSSVVETRTVNTMNRLTQIGGSGTTVVEGRTNEFADVTVNGQPAHISPDPASGGYRFRKSVPVVVGSNTVVISATDQDAQNTTETWQFTAPATIRSFSYDSNGNTLSDGIRTFTWDAKNRLKTVTKSGVTWKWDYDFRDRRVREYENDVLVKLFVWSEDRIHQERSSSNAITRTHYFGGFSDGSTPTTGTKYQTLTDHLGNVREVLTAAGTLAARYDYSSYQGPVKIGTGTVDATFQTIGRYYHHVGIGLELSYYRGYDPELGRWISPDPIGELGGINLYGMLSNSPLSYFDPFGLDMWYDFCGGDHADVTITDPTSKTGFSNFSFAPGDGLGRDGGKLRALNTPGRLTVTAMDQKRIPPGVVHIPTSPEQDARACAKARAIEKNPPVYRAASENCADVVRDIIQAGLGVPVKTHTVTTPKSLKNALEFMLKNRKLCGF